MKIVINNCYGGFSISKKAAEFMAEKGCEIAKEELEKYSKEKYWYGYGYSEKQHGYDRTSPYLVEAVEVLGDEANGDCADLKVIEIPDNIDYYIGEYDGIETVHESHRKWH